jgi:hypothetical protein
VHDIVGGERATLAPPHVFCRFPAQT